MPNDTEQTLGYDKLGRIKTLSTGTLAKEFDYLKSGDHATNLVSKLAFATGGTKEEGLTYSYDEKGNITEVRSNNTLCDIWAVKLLNFFP